MREVREIRNEVGDLVGTLVIESGVLERFEYAAGSYDIPFSLSEADLAGVTSIRDNAFSGCSSLTSIAIPNSVTSIGSQAFRYCSSLTSIEIPEGVTSIGDLSFHLCSHLSSIKIPDSVTSIGGQAFNGCSSLAFISLPGNFTNEKIVPLCLPDDCKVILRALMFPVQRALDKTILWPGNENFQPSWDKLSNAYCKILFTAIMANWRLSKTTLNHIECFPRDMCKITSSHLAQLPNNIWMKIFYYCGKTYFKPWTMRASDTYRSIDLITQLRLTTEPELVPLPVHELSERLTYVRVKEMHQSMWIDELEKRRKHEEQIAPVFKKIEPVMVFPIG